jgi:hypothetical protein
VVTGIVWAAVEDDSIFNLQKQIPQIHSSLSNHFHITMYFGVDSENYSNLIGHKCVVEVSYYAFNHEIQAIWIHPDQLKRAGLDTSNEFAHITWSLRDNVAPVKSNEMLSNSPIFERNMRTEKSETKLDFWIDYLGPRWQRVLQKLGLRKSHTTIVCPFRPIKIKLKVEFKEFSVQ